jgi:hypothetical protein
MPEERMPRDSPRHSGTAGSSEHPRGGPDTRSRSDEVQTTPRDRGGEDVGKTMGGGSSGHKSSARETPE